jgi:cellulose synthase/poly-beta-1,6-N-acetylglucosamine synthase-like glycosyltransferase
MSDTLYNITKLAKSTLVTDAFHPDVLKGFSPVTWIPRIIEQNMITNPDGNLYQAVASLYGIDHVPELTVPLNPKDIIAYRIPTSILIEAQLYPYIKDEKIYIASSTPFVDKDILNDVLSFTGRAGYQLVMTSPHQVRTALQNMYYIEFSTVAESKLKYSRIAMSASPPSILWFARAILFFALLILIGIFVLPNYFLVGLFLVVNVFYIFLNALRFTIFAKAILQKRATSVHISSSDLRSLDDASLPRYTILVPLRFEAAIAARLVKRMAALNYPKSKLQVLFLMGVDDDSTANALIEQGIDGSGASGVVSDYNYYMSIVKVPKAQIDTKPLVCNYGLRFATGDFTAMYDAEDKPEPNQLKKAVIGFQQTTLDTICLQGKLDFYNDRKNILTRLFSLEYGMWFNYFLPGLQAIGSPVPLGGTSNHFVTNALRTIGEWDPYNVTEDADLGMRIYRSKHQTRMLDAYTHEEAASRVGVWLKQRVRWEKGFLTTLIVHLRHPITLYKELGVRRYVFGVTTFFSNFYMPFINPVLWVLTVLWLFNVFSFGELPLYIWLPAVANLVIGNLVYIAMHVVAALRLRRYDTVPLAIFIPLYWLLISVATYMAAWELLTKTYRWNKTPHGE